eukprot:GDKI01006753.1.p2 GENE.GDKI01006753.1~~GDKI01006753.1.p2  ORF type:complete len:137 (+),score=45.00 GDKI01006753.1:33-413(+)
MSSPLLSNAHAHAHARRDSIEGFELPGSLHETQQGARARVQGGKDMHVHAQTTNSPTQNPHAIMEMCAQVDEQFRLLNVSVNSCISMQQRVEERRNTLAGEFSDLLQQQAHAQQLFGMPVFCLKKK